MDDATAVGLAPLTHRSLKVSTRRGLASPGLSATRGYPGTGRDTPGEERFQDNNT